MLKNGKDAQDFMMSKKGCIKYTVPSARKKPCVGTQNLNPKPLAEGIGAYEQWKKQRIGPTHSIVWYSLLIGYSLNLIPKDVFQNKQQKISWIQISGVYIIHIPKDPCNHAIFTY